MAQITSGIRSILSHPAIYNFTQNFLGVKKARKTLVHEYLPKRSKLRVLDIGCGTAEILEFLPDDIQYVGFDASDEYIAQAKQRFGHRGEFFAELVKSAHLEKLGNFDVVLAFGVLHHLDNSEAVTLFELASQALKKDGCIITIDPCFTTNQSSIARWLIEHDRGQDVRKQRGYEQLATPFFASISSIPRHDMLRVPYTYLFMTCYKQKLLSQTVRSNR